MAKKDKVVIQPGKGVVEIEKKYGKGSIQNLGSEATVPCESVSSGAMTLDKALGVWGIPRGRVVEIFGPESSGKTTLTLEIIKQFQKRGLKCAMIDAEHALDPVWAQNIGVDLSKLLLSQPDNAEQGLDIAEILCVSGEAELIVIDSVAALIPRAEVEGEMGDSHVGLQARLMSQALRKLTPLVKRHKCTIIFINQIREKIGVMFGSPETTPGGRALKFYASVRLDIRRTGAIKEGEMNVGNDVRVKVVKNKVAPPFKEAQLKIYFGKPVSGIDGYGALLDMALTTGLAEKNGAWINSAVTEGTLKGVRLGLGVAAAATYLRNNPDQAEELRALVINKIGGPMVNVETPEDDAGFDDTVGKPDKNPSDIDDDKLEGELAELQGSN